jgi:hypothetical protein
LDVEEWAAALRVGGSGQRELEFDVLLGSQNGLRNEVDQLAKILSLRTK